MKRAVSKISLPLTHSVIPSSLSARHHCTWAAFHTTTTTTASINADHMTHVKQLTAAERTTLLPPLRESGWTFAHDPPSSATITTTTTRDTMSKEYIFPDFGSCLGWMVNVGVHAERVAHHPEWFNVYNRLQVTLTTHDAGGLTHRDLHLARWMDASFTSSFPPKKTLKEES